MCGARHCVFSDGMVGVGGTSLHGMGHVNARVHQCMASHDFLRLYMRSRAEGSQWTCSMAHSVEEMIWFISPEGDSAGVDVNRAW